ncbi:MAG: hypothetical protein M1829_003624 [Trizodia sp. TS-e1964]|nr:MAG: hypothetical protein M1829_003624 [Trizodia sp. TS-e1964]
MRLPSLPIILLSFMLASATTAHPKPTINNLANPTTPLTQLSLTNPSLSADCIATMGRMQLASLRTNLWDAYSESPDTALRGYPLIDDLAKILHKIDSALRSSSAADQFVGALIAPELAQMLQGYGDAVVRLPDRDGTTLSLSPSPSASLEPLLPYSPHEHPANPRPPGLSAEFIATMTEAQFKKLKEDIYNAYQASLYTSLDDQPLRDDLGEILQVIMAAEGLDIPRPRFTGASMAPELARMLKQYERDVARLPDSDESVRAMKMFFARLGPENYPPP